MHRPPFDQQMVHLSVADLDRAHAFYAGILGLEPVGGLDACRYYRLGQAAFLALEADGPGDRRRRITLLCDRAYDVDAWHDFLRRRGLELPGPPEDDAGLHVRHFTVPDPDGNPVEIRAFLDPGWPKAGR